MTDQLFVRGGSAAPERSSRARRGLDLVGAACLVTGASSGIGGATARLLAGAEARVAVHGRDRAALDRLAADLGAPTIQGDLTEPGAAEAVAAAAEADLGPLDVVVSNAGAGWAGPFCEMGPAEADCLIALNLTAPVHLARAVVPGMVARGRGCLVLVGSIVGHLGAPQEAVYSATKAALTSLAESLRVELAPAGVDVCLVSPGVVQTAFFERRGMAYARRRPRPIPAGRVAVAVGTAITEGRPRTIVPSWLGLPVALSALTPGLYRRLADRWA